MLWYSTKLNIARLIIQDYSKTFIFKE